MNPAKELTELFFRNTKFLNKAKIYLNPIKIVKLVQIGNHNADTDRIYPSIGKYQDFEFSVNPSKELTELFRRNTKFLNQAKFI